MYRPTAQRSAWIARICLVLLHACSDGAAPAPPAVPNPPPGSPPAGPAASAGSGGPVPSAASAGKSAAAGASAGEGGSGASNAGNGATAGAAGSAPVANDAAYLGLAAPERGFRLATRGREIAPQSDVEYCEVAEVPGSPDQLYVVTAVELANAAGSHHLIVSMAAPGSTSERRLREFEIGEQVPCIGAGQEFGQDGMSVLASTQTRYVRADLPAGVAQRVYGGQRLVFDYHYFNFGGTALTARSAIAVHALAPDAKVTFVSSMAFTNVTIDTPPGTEKTFTAACTLQHDAMLAGLARHTHQYGTDFSVWFEGGERHGELIWTSSDWEHETDFRFPEPLLINAGEGFKFACSFRNEGTRPLRFGIASTDEMCILATAIWSPTPQAELAPEECVVTWIDQQGIGRDADAAGGFPAADPLDALSCHAGTLGISIVEGCLGCICDACATIMARCSADSDCKALLECNTGCMQMGSAACAQMCEPVMFEHSSAVGMIAQVGECIRAGCGDACAIGTPTRGSAP